WGVVNQRTSTPQAVVRATQKTVARGEEATAEDQWIHAVRSGEMTVAATVIQGRTPLEVESRVSYLAGPEAALTGVMMGKDELYTVAEAVCGALRLLGELACGA